jgi:hypothetical protein
MENTTAANSGQEEAVVAAPQGEITMNLFMGVFSVVLVTFFMIVYLVDYNALQRNSKNGSHTKTKLTTVWKAGSCWDKCKDYLQQRFTKFSGKDLHTLIVANFLSLIVYMLFFTLYLLPDLDNLAAAWLASLYIALYGVAKFVSAAYFIVRYQVTAKELQATPKYLISFLWFLNVFAFINMFTSLFSDPPYVELISVSAGYAVAIMFIISYCSIEIILLYMLIRPLSQHIRDLKKNMGSSPPQIGHTRESSDVDSSVPKPLSTKEEHHRIKMIERVVRIAIIACALSVTVTAVENIIYCIAFYVYPDVTSDSGYLIWKDVYNWMCYLEVIVCSLTPVLNYSRFKAMWKLQAFWGQDKIEDIGVETTANKSERNSKPELDRGLSSAGIPAITGNQLKTSASLEMPPQHSV